MHERDHLNISTPASNLIDAKLTEIVLGGFFEVYNHLGRGFLESVYEGALSLVLADAGLIVRRQSPVPVFFRGSEIGFFRADLLVNDRLIVEIKRARKIHTRHIAQLINIMKATPVEVGLLLNYGPKPLFKRVLFTYDRKIQALPHGQSVSYRVSSVLKR